MKKRRHAHASTRISRFPVGVDSGLDLPGVEDGQGGHVLDDGHGARDDAWVVPTVNANFHGGPIKTRGRVRTTRAPVIRLNF